MKTQTSTKVAMSAAIVMGWTWLTAIQCGDINDPLPSTVQDCGVTYDNNFPAGGTVSLNKPAKCPLKVGGTTRIPYAATADLPSGSVTYGFYQNQVVTWNGYTAGFIPNTVWSQGNGRYFVNITGDFYLATGGFDTGNAGWDDVRNGFYSSYTSWWTYATTRIAYSFGIPSNSIDAPGYVGAGAQYSVSATTNDPLLTNPVSWSWYVDGSHLGTTTEPEFTVNGGAAGTMQHVQVVATDGTGHSVSGQTWVTIGSGCGAQLEC